MYYCNKYTCIYYCYISYAHVFSCNILVRIVNKFTTYSFIYNVTDILTSIIVIDATRVMGHKEEKYWFFYIMDATK